VQEPFGVAFGDGEVELHLGVYALFVQGKVQVAQD